MADPKVGGVPVQNSPQGPPPSYTPLGGPTSPLVEAAPNQNTPVVYSQHPSYQTQPNAAYGGGYGAQPGSVFTYYNCPALIICQHCNATVTTNMKYETGLLTWTACGVTALFGGLLGCCLIPFCIDSVKDIQHTCPNCHKMVGLYQRMR